MHFNPIWHASDTLFRVHVPERSRPRQALSQWNDGLAYQSDRGAYAVSPFRPDLAANPSLHTASPPPKTPLQTHIHHPPTLVYSIVQPVPSSDNATLPHLSFPLKRTKIEDRPTEEGSRRDRGTRAFVSQDRVFVSQDRVFVSQDTRTVSVAHAPVTIAGIEPRHPAHYGLLPPSVASLPRTTPVLRKSPSPLTLIAPSLSFLLVSSKMAAPQMKVIVSALPARLESSSTLCKAVNYTLFTYDTQTTPRDSWDFEVEVPTGHGPVDLDTKDSPTTICLPVVDRARRRDFFLTMHMDAGSLLHATTGLFRTPRRFSSARHDGSLPHATKC
ncbi:hypothetical protein NMY22_g18881 [Coprinellus aureogranulatus]|nr:hypothetical protein NMY22_g18881 [Coprinellus aureogranulatus]